MSVQVNEKSENVTLKADDEVKQKEIKINLKDGDDEIEQTIIETVAETLKIEKHKISSTSKFVEDLGADSLDLVEVMMAIEAKFDCDIPDEEAGKIVTIADAAKYIKENA